MMTGIKEENIQSYTEIACLLKYFPVQYINKLPNKLLEIIYNNINKKYIIDINVDKGLNNQNITDNTKKILAVIAFNYWSNESQKQNIKKQLYDNEKIYQENLSKKYSTENLFKNKTNHVAIEDVFTSEQKFMNKDLVVYKESKFRKMIKKILNFFRK